MTDVLRFPCREDESRVRALARGELHGAEAEAVEAHAASCDACAALLDLEMALPGLSGLRDAVQPAGLLDGFTESVMEQVVREDRRRRAGGGLAAAAAVVGLALLLAAGLAGRRPADLPGAPRLVASAPPAGAVTVHSPMEDLFVDPEALVVLVVLPDGEEL